MDVFVNRRFKRNFRSKYMRWRAGKVTANEHGAKPLREDVMRWVIESWNEVPGLGFFIEYHYFYHPQMS